MSIIEFRVPRKDWLRATLHKGPAEGLVSIQMRDIKNCILKIEMAGKKLTRRDTVTSIIKLRQYSEHVTPRRIIKRGESFCHVMLTTHQSCKCWPNLIHRPFFLSIFTPKVWRKRKCWCVIAKHRRDQQSVFVYASEKEAGRGGKEEETHRDTARNGRVVASDNRRTERFVLSAHVLSLYSPLSCSSDEYFTVDDISSLSQYADHSRNREDPRSRGERIYEEDAGTKTGQIRRHGRSRDRDDWRNGRTTTHLPLRALARKCCCAASAAVLCFDARRRAHVNCGPSRPITARRGVNRSRERATTTYVNFAARLVVAPKRKLLLRIAQYYRIRARTIVSVGFFGEITMSLLLVYKWQTRNELISFFISFLIIEIVTSLSFSKYHCGDTYRGML